MTEETENLVLTLLREMRGEIGKINTRIDTLEHRMDARFDALQDQMDARFDQIADLATVIVGAQADTIRRVEDLEGV